MGQTLTRLKKFKEIYGVRWMTTHLNTKEVIIRNLLRGTKKTIPIDLIDKISDIIEDIRKDPLTPDVSILIPRCIPEKYTYIAMSAVMVRGDTLQTDMKFEWNAYQEEPSYDFKKEAWTKAHPTTLIQLNLPFDVQGFARALYKRTEDRWDRIENPDLVKIPTKFEV